MTDREQNIFNMFVSTVAFNAKNSGDYSNLPDAAANFTIVETIISALENYSATQLSGASGRAVEQKSVLDAAIRRKMKRYSRTARALNIDDPGFQRLFRIPDNNNQQLLVAAAREFVVQARLYVSEFASLGIPATLANELEADIDAMETAMSAKATGHMETVGATAGIDEQIEDGMTAEKILDSIMNNVYFDTPVKLAEWTSARHVKKAPQKKEEPTTPTA